MFVVATRGHNIYCDGHHHEKEEKLFHGGGGRGREKKKGVGVKRLFSFSAKTWKSFVVDFNFSIHPEEGNFKR